MKKIVDPLSPIREERDIVGVLRDLAEQENCEGEPYDQIQAAADYIDVLEEEHEALEDENADLKKKEELLYRLARLARNTDVLHPSIQGPEVGAVLLELRLLDGGKYATEVM